MTLEIVKERGALTRTRAAIARGRVTVGFLGGSITDPRVGYNWPEPVIAWLVDRYPDVRFTVENAAIGATGSDSAVFRVQRDIIDRKCDLVFVEYAVNDSGTEPALRARSREGLLRKLLNSGADIVIVYTFSPDMMADMDAGRAPSTIADFETLADHYHLPSVWMGLHALRQLKQGALRWYEWMPDNIHTQFRGSQVYADSVVEYLGRALDSNATPPSRPLPAPLDPLNWENGCAVPFDTIELTGPWSVRRWTSHGWIDYTLETSSPGARLCAPISGRLACLFFDFGRRCCDFRWRVDGGAWTDVKLDRPDWCGDSGWYRACLLAQDLTPDPHRLEIETVYNNLPGCNGTDFKLGIIGHAPD